MEYTYNREYVSDIKKCPYPIEEVTSALDSTRSLQFSLYKHKKQRILLQLKMFIKYLPQAKDNSSHTHISSCFSLTIPLCPFGVSVLTLDSNEGYVYLSDALILDCNYSQLGKEHLM